MMISVVIPVYNAQKILKSSVCQLVEYFDAHNHSYEILLRDDGSVDESAAVLKDLTQKFSKVEYYFNDQNVGIGKTLRALFADAKGDIVIYTDSDLPFGIEVIPRLLREMEKSDIVVASRYSGISNKVNFIRRLTSRLYYSFCKALFNIPVIDIGSGSVAFKKEILNRMTLDLDGFGIHVEIYLKAMEGPALIKEIPMKLVGHQYSSFSILRHGPHIILETFKLWLSYKRKKEDLNVSQSQTA